MDAGQIKRAVGRKAAELLVKSGMKLGLGTGSTAVEAVRRIGELLRDGALRDLRVVPTSFQTEVACREQGISLWSLNDPFVAGRLDLTLIQRRMHCRGDHISGFVRPEYRRSLCPHHGALPRQQCSPKTLRRTRIAT